MQKMLGRTEERNQNCWQYLHSEWKADVSLLLEPVLRGSLMFLVPRVKSLTCVMSLKLFDNFSGNNL